MCDDDVIKKRLLIDGDGTGDDRRLNVLLKQFIKWMNSKNESPENNQIIYDRLMAQLAQCQFSAAKTEFTTRMIQTELENYQKLSESISKNIEGAKNEIENSKKELTIAKQIRKNKMEYDQLAKVIKQQPDRVNTQFLINNVQKELTELGEKKLKLQRKFEKRQKDFTVLMYAVRELESQLAEDSSNDNNVYKKSDEDDAPNIINHVASTAIVNMEVLSDEEIDSSLKANRQISRHKSFRERDITTLEYKMNDGECKSIQESIGMDEDAILELSIEKEEPEDKIDDLTNVTS